MHAIFGIFPGLIEGHNYFTERPVLCDTISTLCLTACVNALFSIGGISFNRYLNICHTNLYSKIFSPKKNILFCLSFWCVGIILSLPALVGWTQNVYDHKMLECIWNRLHSKSFTIFFSAFIVATPVAIITYSFVRIFLSVRASRKRVAALSHQDSQSVTTSNCSKTTKNNSRSQAQRSSIHLAITLSVIFLVFVICWTPYALIVVIDMNDKQPLSVYLYILLFAHLHASLNCIVYGVTNRLFRQAYVQVLSKLVCKKFCRFLSSTNADQDISNRGMTYTNNTVSNVKPINEAS